MVTKAKKSGGKSTSGKSTSEKEDCALDKAARDSGEIRQSRNQSRQCRRSIRRSPDSNRSLLHDRVTRRRIYQGARQTHQKVALITGGDSGIGRAVAVLFAREGADVAFTYLPEEETDAQETGKRSKTEGRAAIRSQAIFRTRSFPPGVVKQTVANSASSIFSSTTRRYQQHQESLDELTDEQWDRTFKTNIYGYFRVTKARCPHLKKGSAIINTGSITGLEGSKHLLDYSATKGAIHAFTKSLAQNLVEKGIRVNCVAPGPVWTPLNPSDKPAQEVAEFGADTPMKRPAQPEEIAPAFVYFASEVDSSYVTGEVLTLLGGETTAA